MYNETYDEYIRSILGYAPVTQYENNYQEYRSPSNTADAELEGYYPEIYKIVYPMISKKCSNINTSVTNADIQNMTDEIFFALEEKKTETSTASTVKTAKTTNENRETRQSNRQLRDLIQILLIRELLRRRQNEERPGRPPMPRPPVPRPPMRPPFRPGFGTGNNIFNRDFEMSNYDIFEN